LPLAVQFCVDATLTIYAERRGPLTQAYGDATPPMKNAGPRFVSSGPALSSSIALRSKID
jgi:hypothetical protein